MSWSIDGSVRRPFEVSALLRRTREVLGELLATDEVPELSGNAPTVTIEPVGTDITFTVLLPTGDGAEVDTVDITEWSDDDTMFVTVTARYNHAVTRVSVVLCIAVALAVADLGGGEYLDEERAFVTPPMYDPHEVIAKTRLAPSDLTFVDRCARYLGQFRKPEDWPRVVTLAEEAKPPQR
ncbi:hypothetical protein ACFOWZ_08850 [Lentzea rhizosphaerae]|uniref:Immunity protein Imm1 n=1 Tax=Lentzea rhizosphaerae TaxID=2041025 RepID=A0ABV8BMN1_9PSEU